MPPSPATRRHHQGYPSPRLPAAQTQELPRVPSLVLTERDADAPLGELADHLAAPLDLRGQGDDPDTVQGPVGGQQVLEGTCLEGADAVLWVCPLLLLADERSFQVGPCSDRNSVTTKG